MTRNLFIQNRQKSRKIDTGRLRKVLLFLLGEELNPPSFDVGFYLVDDSEMTMLNETHLRHFGTTDVITFDYTDPEQSEWLCGEIFICVPEALRQAKRFQAHWRSEVVRYAVHGVLHLRGYDDRNARLRTKMKIEENRLLKTLARQFRTWFRN